MSSPRKPTRASGGARKPSVSAERAELLRGMTMNAQTITVLVMIVLAIFTLAPQVQLWFEQRQAIADLQSQVQARKDAVKEMQVQRNRWNDPAFVRAQARNRLFYVMPGEVSYVVMDANVVNDSDVTGTVGEDLAAKTNYTDITTKISATKNDWMGSLVETVVRAGVEKPLAAKQ
ncbi:MAG: septum formation initiator family protein [Rhodoluna sp.]|nr:septum formation initiator family protein [Rhodoluna sp.]